MQNSEAPEAPLETTSVKMHSRKRLEVRTQVSSFTEKKQQLCLPWQPPVPQQVDIFKARLREKRWPDRELKNRKKMESWRKKRER